MEHLEVPTHFAIGVKRQKKKHELKKCNEPRSVIKASPYQLERNQKQICGLRLLGQEPREKQTHETENNGCAGQPCGDALATGSSNLLWSDPGWSNHPEQPDQPIHF